MMSVFVCGLSRPLSDDGGGHQDVGLAGGELLHGTLELLFRHLTMRHTHARLAGGRLHARHGVLDGAHAVGHVVHLAATP